MVRIAAKIATMLALTYLTTRLWLGSWWSEKFWTWLNHHLSAGEDPGLASDVEFIIVLVVTLAASFVFSHVLFKQVERLLKRSASHK